MASDETRRPSQEFNSSFYCMTISVVDASKLPKTRKIVSGCPVIGRRKIDRAKEEDLLGFNSLRKLWQDFRGFEKKHQMKSVSVPFGTAHILMRVKSTSSTCCRYTSRSSCGWDDLFLCCRRCHHFFLCCQCFCRWTSRRRFCCWCLCFSGESGFQWSENFFRCWSTSN